MKVLSVNHLLLGFISLVVASSAQAQQVTAYSSKLPTLPPLGSNIGLPGSSQPEVESYKNQPRQTMGSGAIYKLIMPNGSVTYSDKPLPGGKIEKKMVADAGQNGIRFSAESAPLERGSVISSSALEESRAQKIEEAEKDLKKALDAQKQAAEFLATDRKFSINSAAGRKKTSRISEEYFERQNAAEERVSKARQRLEAAQVD